MKKITNIIYGSVLAGVLFSAPLAGNAYFCSNTKSLAVASEPVGHPTKEIRESDMISALQISAKSCLLMDNSGKVILQKNCDQKLPMASMTKMMTLLIVMEEINRGAIDLNQSVIISEYAASQEGSECFLDAGKPYLIKDLIKSVVVASANDSTVALAEIVSGSEKAFVTKMNNRAAELGLSNTHFINSTGLDESGHYSTAQDLAKLITKLDEFDLLKEYSKVWMYDMEHAGGRVTNLTNTNRLIRTNKDLVFAKTGHTDAAGYCITAMAERNGTTLIACVMGLEDSKARFLEAETLLNFGFSNYESVKIVDDDTAVGEIIVKHGKQKSVKVYPKEDVAVLRIKGEKSPADLKLEVPESVDAPVTESSSVGKLIVTIDGETYSTDVVAGADIEKKSFSDIARELMQ